MLHKDGCMDDVSYTIYERYFSMYEGNFELNGIIYLHADPEVCYERIAKRSRTGESNIELDYLRNCCDFHNQWLLNTKTPVLKIDVNENVENNNTMVQVWLEKALSFIGKDEKENIISSF